MSVYGDDCGSQSRVVRGGMAQGRYWIFPVRTDTVVMDNAGGVGLIYLDDVRWTCTSQFLESVIMHDDLIVGFTGDAVKILIGIQSRSSSGVARRLDVDPGSGTSSPMKPNGAPSGATELVEIVTLRQYSSDFSSLRDMHAQNFDHQRLRAHSVSS